MLNAPHKFYYMSLKADASDIYQVFQREKKILLTLT